MNNYQDDKKKLDAIRNNFEYCTKGDILFRTALLMVFEAGFDQMKEKEFLESCLKYNEEKHTKAKAEGKLLFVTKEFDEAIYKCAHEIAQLPTISVVMYSQREIFFYDGQDPSYQDLIRMMKSCLNYIEEQNECVNISTLWDFRHLIDLSDEDINFFGYDYLLEDCDEEEESEE